MFENLTSMKAASATDEKGLEDELASWHEKLQSDSSKLAGLVSAGPEGGLWEGMPTIDSKVVTETSPIFERHLGIPLDVTCIRPGGYTSFRDLVSDLVPKMKKLAQLKKSKDSEKKGDDA
jgi:aspartate-semialdehyde dehydrogenase